MTAGTAMVFRLQGITYRYLDRELALDGVDLEVYSGERLAILGANGCGKSTLLKIMDGLHRPSKGTIEAFGQDITAIADDGGRSQQFHRRVGLVFQDADVQLFSPTVRDDVAFGPLQMGWSPSRVEAAIEKALDLMNVGHLADRAPYELSGGEKKRAAIASVLALDPEVLLLDEPTANLDPRSKALLMGLIDNLGRTGKTVVLTTQEMEIVPAVATRVVVFGDRERRPIASGPPANILNDTALLVSVNLVHEHLHYHGPVVHTHRHGTTGEHHVSDTGLEEVG